MDKEIDREEYVLADFGYIWVGTARNNTGIPWQFGQVNLKFPFFQFFFLPPALNQFNLVLKYLNESISCFLFVNII